MDEPTVSIGAAPIPLEADPLSSWGSFRLLNKVGQGGFGEVYRAWDSNLQREVALKLLLHGADDDEAYAAMLREARLMARVRHPNIVPVYGVDRQEGRVGFWSDFVRGNTLSALLALQGPFGPRETALIGVELCRALSAVHAAGLLHRDIKTGNVMREEGGRILLMDFGLSSDSGHGHAGGGTPLYMAPELLSGGNATVATDIYALGVLLFHLSSGKYPVEADRLDELRAAHSSGARRTLIDTRPDLPEGFARTIETAIDPDPAKRYASAGQMLAGLSEGSEAEVQVRKPRWRREAVVAAIVLALAGSAYFTKPVLQYFQAQKVGTSTSVYDAYLAAQDLLVRYDKKGNLDTAIDSLKKIVAEDPNFALGYAALGRAYFLKYRTTRDSALVQKARDASNRALALDKQLAPVHATLGLLYNITGQSALAMQEVRQALQLDASSPENYAAEADVYRSQGRTKDAESALQKAIDLAPDDWRWANQLGILHYETGKWAEAASQYKKATEIAPDNAIALTNLGMVYYKQDRFSEARAILERSIQIQPRFSSYGTLGSILSTEGKYPEAAVMYQKAVDLNKTDYITWGNLGSAYLRSGDKEKAKTAHQQAIALAERSKTDNRNDGRLLAFLAGYYAVSGQPDRSLPLLRQAIAVAPDNIDVIYHVGETYEVLGHRADALRWITKALDLGFSPETVRRSPELADLRADPHFSVSTPTIKSTK